MPLSDDDQALFRSVMTNVKPLHQTKTLAHPDKPRNVGIPQPRDIGISKPRKISHDAINLSNYYTETVNANTILSYHHNIPKKRLRELKNGLIPWETRLDLHGYTLDQAQNTLCNFIEQESNQSHRCLLIIHGKGSRHGEAPILKNHVNHWLKQLPNILAFHSALPQDGGTGAIYVLLKK